MKGFSSLQIAALSILSVVVIALVVISLVVARNISPAPTTGAAVEITHIGLAEPRPSSKPALTFDEQELFPDITPTASSEAVGALAVKQTVPRLHIPEGASFVLTIGSKNVEIACGVTEDILESGPGWLDTSAAPGQEGICVVYGHRNRNHLKALEKVDYGDTIMATMPDGMQYCYTIESIEIVASDAELRIPTLDGRCLMLVTCYPFHYSGHAPGEFQIISRIKG